MTRYEITTESNSLGTIELPDYLNENEIKQALNKKGIYLAYSTKLGGKTGEILYFTGSNITLIRQ